MRLSTFAIFAALVASTEAGVCKPKPKPESGATHSDITPPAISINIPTSQETPGASPTETPAVSSAAVDPSASSAPAPPPPAAATPPAGVDKSKPWLPQDPTNAANITASSTGDDISGNSAVSKWVLQYHNEWRAQFGASPLTWDSSLAQSTADHTQSCEWAHRGADNLAGTSFFDPANVPANTLMDMWSNEWPDSYNADGSVKPTHYDHFTAQVWKASTKLGCAWNTGCPKGTAYELYFVCKYDPAPNMYGETANQVGTFVAQ